MHRFVLLLLPAVLFAGQVRFARLSQLDGAAEVQHQAADPWLPAERNLTLTESAWLHTGPSSRLEIELDEGSALRLGADSLVALSDYSQLSTGQRVTVLALDRGLAYFTGEPERGDALVLAVPGAQITLTHGARVRIEALDTVSRISVIEGVVRLTCPAAELDIREGQTVRVEPADTARFGLDREIAAMDLDRWSEERDKALAAPAAAMHVALRYGLADLDGAGEWLSTDTGMVWHPRVADGWAPFQKGRWRWYDSVGYTWVSDDPWGWAPYHYGRWTRRNDLGWVWVPPSKPVFKPGDVYWLWGRGLAGWGPLAPGENWQQSVRPEQFLDVNTTYAALAMDAHLIDPGGFAARPKDPLAVAVFALALPSPAFLPSRLEAQRPALRAVATKPVVPVLPGTSVSDADSAPPPPPPPPPVPVPASDPVPDVQPDPLPNPGPGGPPVPVVYPVPVYTGIVVINPPEHPDYSRHNPNRGNNGNGGGHGKPTPPPSNPPTAPPIQTNTIDPPRVGIPAPQRTDRPRLDAPPVRSETREQLKETRSTPPSNPPRVGGPAPQRVDRPRLDAPPVRSETREQLKESRPTLPSNPPRVSGPAPQRVDRPRLDAPPVRSEAREQPRESRPAPAPRQDTKPAPSADAKSGKSDTATRKR